MKSIRWLAGIMLLTLCAQPSDGADEAKGNLRYSITVSHFENKAGWSGRWNLGDAFTTILTDALQESGHFIVLGDKTMRREAMAEQDFAASGRAAGGKKAPKTGRMTPAQLLVRGDITHVQDSTTGGRGGLSFRGIRIGGRSDKAEVNITMYLVDSETGQVKASTKLVGESGRKGLSLGYHGSALGGVRGDIDGFRKDNVGKACENAIVQGVEFLVAQLDAITWEGSVVLATGGKIMMNRGTREGVSEGDRFQIGSTIDIVDPDTGEVLASDMTTVATVEAENVRERITTLKVIDGKADAIEKGMSVFAAK